MTTLQIRNDAMVELLRADFYSREDHVVLSDDMWIELDERAAPAVPAADRIRVFSRDDGAGNSQLCFIDSAGVVVCSGGGVAAPHNILSATHLDAAVQAVSRGSLIYGDATPDWNELVIGAQYAHLESDGVDVAWQANLTMADDTYIGLGAAAGRLVFDSTPAPDQVEVTAADLNFVTTGHGIIHVDGVSAGPPRQLLIANGTRYLPGTLAATDLAAHNLLSAQHGDTVVSAMTRGDLVVGTAAGWDDLAHPGGAGYAFTTDANDVLWDQTPTWTGLHTFSAGWLTGGQDGDLDGGSLIFDQDADTSMYSGLVDDIIIVHIAGAPDFSFTSNAFNVLSGSDIVMADGSSIGQAAGPLLTFDDSNNYLEITGCSVGIGVAAPATLLHLYNIAGAGESFRISADAVGSFGMGVFAGEIFSLGHDGAQHFNMNNAGTTALRTSTIANAVGLYVPWLSGDGNATSFFGSSNASNNQIAVHAQSYSNTGVRGVSESSIGVTGISVSGQGVTGQSTSDRGVTAISGTGVGLQVNLTGAGTAILDCRDGGTTAFIVDDGGNVGVGALAAPSQLLEVFKNQNAVTAVLINNPNAGANANARLAFVTDGGTSIIYRTSNAYTVAALQDDLVIQETGGGDIVMYGAAEIARFQNAGHVLPGSNKGQNLGAAALRWNTLYQGTSTAAGTSRVFESTRDCPLCSTRMVRGTGSLCILGEDRDYEVAHCPDCGVMAVEEMKHLPSARLAERRPPPKVEFLGLDVFPMSGNSRKVQVCFRYVDGEDEVINSTFLGETELADLMAMDEATRRTFLLELGRREWEALEELRIQEEEVATLQGTLDELVEKFVGVDLLQ